MLRLGEQITRGNEGVKYYSTLTSGESITFVVVKDMGGEWEAKRQVAVIEEIATLGVLVPEIRKYILHGGCHFLVCSDFSQNGNLVWSPNDDEKYIKKFYLTRQDINSIKIQVEKIHSLTKGKFAIRYDAFFLLKLGENVCVALGDFGRVYSRAYDYSKYEPNVNYNEYEINGLEYIQTWFIDPISKNA